MVTQTTEASAVGGLEADGTFCIPADVVKYLGEKYFKDLVAETQAEISGSDELDSEGQNPFMAMAADD